MGKKLKLFVVSVSIFLLATILGCSMFQDVITPCYINKNCATYADTPLKMFTPYTSLFDAKRIAAKMEYINAVGTLKYAFLKEVLDLSIVGSEQFKQKVFDPTGPIGGLLLALPSFGLGALLVSKPEDKKKIATLEKTNGNK